MGQVGFWRIRLPGNDESRTYSLGDGMKCHHHTGKNLMT